MQQCKYFMNSYSKLTSVYIRIWIIASLINAVASTVLILSSWSDAVIVVFSFSLICSFLFSIPILLAAMFIAAVVATLKKDYDAFQLVLWVTYFVVMVGAVCFRGFFEEIDRNPVPLCVSVIVSAVAAVIICRNKIRVINTIQE